MKWLFLWVCTLSGCAAISYVQTGDQYEPLKESDPVEVVMTKAPRCPYDEIGLIKAVGSLEAGMKAIQQKARQVGADAVIITRTGTQTFTKDNTIATADGFTHSTEVSSADTVQAVAVHLRCAESKSPPPN